MLNKQFIIEGIQKAKAEGYHCQDGLQDFDGECGCALTLAALGNNLCSSDELFDYEEKAYLWAATLLGLTAKERMDITNSFDSFSFEDTEAGLFGVELQRFIDIDSYNRKE